MTVSMREQLTRKKPLAKADPGGHQGGHAGPSSAGASALSR